MLVTATSAPPIWPATSPCASTSATPARGAPPLCEKCGRSDEIEGDEVTLLLALAAVRAGFAPHRQMAGMQGVCQACAKAA